MLMRVLVAGLLTFLFPVIAGSLVTIDASDNPSYQAIIEPVWFGNGQEQRSTFVINMEDSASFKLGSNSAETSTILVKRSEIPGKDFIVFIDSSVTFENDLSMGFNHSAQKLSSRLPLSDGERILVGGNRVITEQNGITSEVITEVWFTLNQQ
ncbi:hypothetical protein L4D09_24500 [Photobacterium makurazakiensis]|uniref:hypothetical protein n=1 Tax=Photobacterium makurazakiensis TaxID=2910234 RepID=UPI003D0D5CE9